VPGGTPAGNLLHSAIANGPFDGIVVANIPYGTFDMYLYMAGVQAGTAIFKIDHANSAAEQLSVVGLIDISGSTIFTFSTLTQPGNYLFLGGLSGPTLYIGGSALVEGLQIVAVPEPSSIALAAFGFIGLMAWGWRRQKR
jgi:hypothetical protein